MELETFEVESCVRGHHIYSNVWSPSLGERLQCTREFSNTKDRYAVSVVRLGTIVGHIPRKIAAACALFLARNGTISCEVTGICCYSGDLPQGGLEIPCKLTFRWELKVVRKLKALLSYLPAKNEVKNENEPPSKKKKIELEKAIDVEKILDPCPHDPTQNVWLKLKGICLTKMDKDIIVSGKELTDKHINFSQEIIKMQFPHVSGLHSTLFLATYPHPPVTSAHIQIVHARGNHWVAVTNIGCASKVLVFDSLYSSVDKETLKLVTTIFGRVDIEMGVFSQQYGATDCGLFSIAVCVALANKQQPGRFA